MIEAFLAAFVVALSFTLFSFVVLSDDFENKDIRPIFLLAIATTAWFITPSLLVAPATQTTNTTLTGVPVYCIANAANALSANVAAAYPCGTTIEHSSQVLTTETPLSPYAFLGYQVFAYGLSLITGIFWLIFALKFGVRDLIDTMKNLGKRNK